VSWHRTCPLHRSNRAQCPLPRRQEADMRTQLTPLELRRRATSRRQLQRTLCALLGAFAMAALHAEEAKLSVEDGTGPEPELPKPNTSLFPTVDIAPAVGWQPGEAPTPA